MVELAVPPWTDHCDVTWVAVAVILISFFVLAPRVFSFRTAEATGPGGRVSIIAEDYPTLKIPEHPRVEAALDPASGLLHSNPSDSVIFDTGLCSGTFMLFHSPTCVEPERAGSLDFRDYFKGKKRLWEFRVSFRFKQPPPVGADMFLGIVLDKYVPTNGATKRVVALIVTAIRKALKSVYHTFGDDPDVVHGECERPAFVFPLWAFDQFIETPEGEEPPSLTDIRFPEMGCKRSKRVSQYVKEMEALRQSFRVGPCYTFALWGPARFADPIAWQLVGIPFVTPFDLERVTGPPLAHAMVYTLSPSSDPQDGRHLDSRKRHCFRVAWWSSNKRPPRDQFESMTGAKQACEEADAAASRRPQEQGLHRLLGKIGKAFDDAVAGSVVCCTRTRQKTACVAA